VVASRYTIAASGSKLIQIAPTANVLSVSLVLDVDVHFCDSLGSFSDSDWSIVKESLKNSEQSVDFQFGQIFAGYCPMKKRSI
jgi:hypothetical protein